MASLKTIVLSCASPRTGAAQSQDQDLYFDKKFEKDFQVAIFVETFHKSFTDITLEIFRYPTDFHIVHSPVSNVTHARIIGLIRKKYIIAD